MFTNDIGTKIKGLAKISLFLGIIIGGLWLWIAIGNTVSGDYYDAQKGFTEVALSVYLIVASIVGFFPLYGFGILVENSEIMRKNSEITRLYNEDILKMLEKSNTNN